MNAIFPGDKYTISMMEFILKICEDCPYFFSISTPAILQPGMSKSQTHVCISLHWWFNWWYHEATVTTLHPPLYALVNSTLKPGLYKRTPHLHMHIGEMTKSLNWKGTQRALKLIFEVHLSLTKWFHLRKELSTKIWMWSLSILKREKKKRKRGKKYRCNKQTNKKSFQNWTRSKKLTVDR